MTIADEICKYDWLSAGAAAQSLGDGARKPAHYSKYGMIFTAKRVPFPYVFNAFIHGDPNEYTVLKSTDGVTITDRLKTQPDQRRCVQFTIDQTTHTPLIDPLTGNKMVKFPETFVALFQEQVFIEYDNNCLVGPTLSVPELAQSVSYVITLTTDNGHLAMLQRARWSDGYISTYCCEARDKVTRLRPPIN